MTLADWSRKPGVRTTIRWALAAPFRAVAAARWLPRGRGIGARLAQRLAWGTVEQGSDIVARTPSGSLVALASNTLLGRAVWTYGEFESAELAAAGRLATAGSWAIDVGANVGLFTIEMSRAVRANGRVIAIEPWPATVDQLRANLERNRCANVDVVIGAAVPEPGDIDFQVTDDPAFHSAGGKPIGGHPTLAVVTVPGFTLDALWVSAGRPSVSFIKIDVEGGERGVLEGAMALLAECRPRMIVEVMGRDGLDEVMRLLSSYRLVEAPGFTPANRLLAPR